MSSGHSSAESPSVDAESIAPPGLWVTGSLDSPSFLSGSSFNFFDCSDFFNCFGDFLAFPDDSFLFAFEGVLVSISCSHSLAALHDPSPSPSPDPFARACSLVPFIPIAGSDSLSSAGDPSPFPFPLECLAFVGCFSSSPVAAGPVPLIPEPFAVDDSPSPGPLSFDDSLASVFVVESIPDSLSMRGPPSPLPSSGSGLCLPPLVPDSDSLATSGDPLPFPSPSSASASTFAEFSDDSFFLPLSLHELSTSDESSSSH